MGLFAKKKRNAATIRAEIQSLQKELKTVEPASAGDDGAERSEVKVAPMAGAQGQVAQNLKPSSSSNALFATLSHELRTPLNGVLGMAQLLREELDSPKLDTLESCAQHMLSVLHTLVNLTKIQQQWGELPEHREWVNFRDLLEQIKKNIAQRALSRRLQIKLNHANDRIRLRGDYDHLVHIIETAILGSLECTDLDTIVESETMVVTWKVTGEDVEVVIENPLEIMPENRGLRIFEVTKLTTGDAPDRIRMEYLYWSVSISLLEHYQGAMMASKMNEKIGVKTILGFKMENMEASSSQQKPVGGLSLETPSAVKSALPALPFSLNVLIVEDDPISRDLLSLLLKRIGQNIQVAANGQIALDLLDAGETFDVILMDIDMPVMDGMMTTRELRLKEIMEDAPQTPVVAVTAFNTLSDQGKFKKAGMNYFLSKPVSAKELRSVLIEVTRESGEL